MSYSRRRLKADPFTDLLFNILLSFTLLMFLAIIFMNPIPKTGVINPKAEYIITVSWKDNSPDDVDTYVQSPTGDLVWFRGKEAGFVHLDRDDRGLLNDTIEINGEKVQAPKINLVNTNGAGDALLGAYIALESKLGKLDALMEAVNYASKVCSINSPRLI